MQRRRLPADRGQSMVCAALTFGFIATASTTARAQEWPGDDTWQEVRCGLVPAYDPRRDTPGADDALDVVGDTAHPALYTAADEEYWYVRMRVDGDPVEMGILEPFGWAVELDTDLDESTYEWIVIADGTGDPQQVHLFENSRIQLADDPADLPDVLVSSYPAETHARVVVADLDFESDFGGDADFFVDLAFPFEDLRMQGIGPGDPVGLVMGTSSNGQSINEDVACHDPREDGAARWSRVYTNSVRTDGGRLIDTDGDGLSDADEQRLGSDPRDASDPAFEGMSDTEDGPAIRGGGGPAGCSATGGSPLPAALWLMTLVGWYRRKQAPRAR